MTKKKKERLGQGEDAPRSVEMRGEKAFSRRWEREGGSCVTVISKMLHLPSQMFLKRKIPRRAEEGARSELLWTIHPPATASCIGPAQC